MKSGRNKEVGRPSRAKELLSECTEVCMCVCACVGGGVNARRKERGKNLSGTLHTRLK